jgi:hypothetical protein
VFSFFDGGFLGVSRDGGIGKWNFREVGLGGDGALGTGAGDADRSRKLVDSNAVDGEVVEVCFEVFEVEGEVEDVGVGECGGFGFFGNAAEDETGERRGAEREHLAPALYDDVI